MFEPNPEYRYLKQIDSHSPWINAHEPSVRDQEIIDINYQTIGNFCEANADDSFQASIENGRSIAPFYFGPVVQQGVSISPSGQGLGQVLKIPKLYSDGCMFLGNERSIRLVIGYDNSEGAIGELRLLREGQRQEGHLRKTIADVCEDYPHVTYLDLAFEYLDGESDMSLPSYLATAAPIDGEDLNYGAVHLPQPENITMGGGIVFSRDGQPLDHATKLPSRPLSNIIQSIYSCSKELADL